MEPDITLDPNPNASIGIDSRGPYGGAPVMSPTDKFIRCPTGLRRPALTPGEWKEALAWPHGVTDYIVAPAEQLGYGKNSPAHIHAVAALANAALPDGDPHKITRLMVYCVQQIARRECLAATDAAFLRGLADVLDALLPPE